MGLLHSQVLSLPVQLVGPGWEHCTLLWGMGLISPLSSVLPQRSLATLPPLLFWASLLLGL